MDILIFTSGALKTWVLHVNTFYSWILLHIYRPWQPLTYLYFPYHCISLIYFSFTKIRMFLYAQIYWLAEFGDVSCLQFNYLRVETLTPTWEDLVEHLSDNFKSEVRQNSVSDLSVWSLIHLEGSVCTAEGADKYETGTNVTRTTKKTPLTTFMKGEEWRLFLSFLFKSDKFSDFFDIAG